MKLERLSSPMWTIQDPEEWRETIVFPGGPFPETVARADQTNPNPKAQTC